jgi:NAD(P)-dependent dehydrogenase (short-subunit alcohol dehydrogenase family)
MDAQLQGSVALVVGGASGIGWATAQAFAAEGARVVIADLDAAAARTRADSLPGSRAIEVDVTDESSVAAMIESILTTEGRLDAVVNCAGLGHVAFVADHELSDWQRIIDVCLTGAFLVLKHAARAVEDGGSLVTIASLNARQAAQGYAAYCAAKSGVCALVEVTALELGSRRVRVNAISPGLVDTPLTEELKSIPGVQEDFTDNTPLGRNGIPEEIAAAAVFLSSPLSAWTTGATIDVNGGGHLRRYPDVMQQLAALVAAAPEQAAS